MTSRSDESPARSRPRLPRGAPAWLSLLAAAMLTGAALESLERSRLAEVSSSRARAARLPALGLPPAAAPELATAGARELRRLPGVGRRRAEAIVRAREEHGGADFPLRTVHGIGQATEQRIRDWLAAQRVQSSAGE